MHWNILASYLGRNAHPWFLFPLNLTEARRASITRKYNEREGAGRWAHSLQDNFGGLLSDAERRLVEGHERLFHWEGRRERMLGEIRRLDADVVSLVEMDRFAEFEAALGREAYEGAFARRPQRRSLDGSSLFWEPRGDGCYQEDRVMLAVALRHRGSGRVLVAASVHLMRNPEDTGKDAMRMLEVSQMMRALSCFVASAAAEGLVVMGDFNAVPQSWTHLFALHGWQDCVGSDKGMRDAFEAVEWGERDEVCTTRTVARVMWIDYIFYSGRTMELDRPPSVLPCPGTPIPDEVHPSDHLPISAHVRFAPGARALDQRSRPDEAFCSAPWGRPQEPPRAEEEEAAGCDSPPPMSRPTAARSSPS